MNDIELLELAAKAAGIKFEQAMDTANCKALLTMTHNAELSRATK